MALHCADIDPNSSIHPDAKMFDQDGSILVPESYDYYEWADHISVQTGYMRAVNETVAGFIYDGLRAHDAQRGQITQLAAQEWNCDEIYSSRIQDEEYSQCWVVLRDHTRVIVIQTDPATDFEKLAAICKEQFALT